MGPDQELEAKEATKCKRVRLLVCVQLLALRWNTSSNAGLDAALFCQEAFDTCTTGSEEIGQERCKAN